MRLLFCLFPHYYSFIIPHQQKIPWSSAYPQSGGGTLPTPYHRSFKKLFITIFLIYYSFCVLFLIGIFILTNTVRTQVAKTAKSQLHFYLFVILLFLLLQLVSIRSEDLQTQTLTTSAITSDPDTLVLTPPGGTA